MPLILKDKTLEEFVDELNKTYPVSLKHNSDLVDRVYERYPLIDKTKVAMVIKDIFSSIRELMFLGYMINFFEIFHKSFIEAKMKSKKFSVFVRAKTRKPYRDPE